MFLWLEVYGSFFVLWALGAVFARRDNFVTVKQMRSHGQGFEKGIPLIGHMACLVLDALPFPALMATWIMLYGNQWKFLQILVAAIGALVLSGVMHLTYIEGGKKFPEFVTHDGKLTPAGWTHVLFMAYGFAIVGLAYFCTSDPAPILVRLTSVYLVIHVMIGVHVLHKIWTPSWFPHRGVFDAGTLLPIIGTAFLLAVLTLWRMNSL